MHEQILNECVADSFSGTTTFGETVGRMMEDGVEWYSANLLLGATIHYAADGARLQVNWPGWSVPFLADAFDAGKVIASIRASQKREILYPEFLRRIADAGTVYYTVHMQGKKAIYFGRHGDFHIELFPQPK